MGNLGITCGGIVCGGTNCGAQFLPHYGHCGHSSQQLGWQGRWENCCQGMCINTNTAQNCVGHGNLHCGGSMQATSGGGGASLPFTCNYGTTTILKKDLRYWDRIVTQKRFATSSSGGDQKWENRWGMWWQEYMRWQDSRFCTTLRQHGNCEAGGPKCCGHGWTS